MSNLIQTATTCPYCGVVSHPSINPQGDPVVVTCGDLSHHDGCGKHYVVAAEFRVEILRVEGQICRRPSPAYPNGYCTKGYAL